MTKQNEIDRYYAPEGCIAVEPKINLFSVPLCMGCKFWLDEEARCEKEEEEDVCTAPSRPDGRWVIFKDKGTEAN